MEQTEYCNMVCGRCENEVNVLGPEDGHEPSAILVDCTSCGQGIGYFACEINYQHN